MSIGLVSEAEAQVATWFSNGALSCNSSWCEPWGGILMESMADKLDGMTLCRVANHIILRSQGILHFSERDLSKPQQRQVLMTGAC